MSEDDRTRIFVDDGLKFINQAASQNDKKWDIVIIDINSSDPNSDLWGPTKDFLDEKFLNECKTILGESGNRYLI